MENLGGRDAVCSRKPGRNAGRYRETGAPECLAGEAAATGFALVANLLFNMKRPDVENRANVGKARLHLAIS